MSSISLDSAQIKMYDNSSASNTARSGSGTEDLVPNQLKKRHLGHFLSFFFLRVTGVCFFLLTCKPQVVAQFVDVIIQVLVLRDGI